jgi:hypothetical protein
MNKNLITRVRRVNGRLNRCDRAAIRGIDDASRGDGGGWTLRGIR